MQRMVAPFITFLNHFAGYLIVNTPARIYTPITAERSIPLDFIPEAKNNRNTGKHKGKVLTI